VIVDTHVHVVARDSDRYPWRPRGRGHDWYIDHGVTVEAYRVDMVAAGVDRALLVQAVSAYTTDNAYVLDAMSSAPDVFRSVVVVDDGGALRAAVRDRGACAVRVIGADRDIEPIVACAADLAVPVVIAIAAPAFDAVASLVARFPSVTFALDHCGFASTRDDALRALVAHGNVTLKVTSITLQREPDAFDALVPEFGADRLMWGSDWSQTHDRPYAALVDLARDATARLAPADRAAVLHDTAARIFAL